MIGKPKPRRVVLYSARVSVDEEDVVDVSIGAPQDVTVRRILVESVSRPCEVLGVAVPVQRRDYLHEVSTVSSLPQLKNEGVGLKTFERLRLRVPLRCGELMTVKMHAFREDVMVRLVAECDLGITEEGER